MWCLQPCLVRDKALSVVTIGSRQFPTVLSESGVHHPLGEISILFKSHHSPWSPIRLTHPAELHTFKLLPLKSRVAVDRCERDCRFLRSIRNTRPSFKTSQSPRLFFRNRKIVAASRVNSRPHRERADQRSSGSGFQKLPVLRSSLHM